VAEKNRMAVKEEKKTLEAKLSQRKASSWQFQQEVHVVADKS